MQVLKLSAEKDAYEKHAKLLGETLRQVRKSAAEHHIKEEDLGEDLQSKLNLKPEDVVGIVESVAQDEYPHLAALRLTAQENGWLIDPSEVNPVTWPKFNRIYNPVLKFSEMIDLGLVLVEIREKNWGRSNSQYFRCRVARTSSCCEMYQGGLPPKGQSEFDFPLLCLSQFFDFFL